MACTWYRNVVNSNVIADIHTIMRGFIHYTDAADGHSGGRGRCRSLTQRRRTHAEQG